MLLKFMVDLFVKNQATQITSCVVFGNVSSSNSKSQILSPNTCVLVKSTPLLW